MGAAENELELLVVRAPGPTPGAGGTVQLLCPSVGLFAGAAEKGTVLTAGQRAGSLITLGRAAPLIVPGGVSGVVRSERPEPVRAPVDYGAVLYELEGLDALDAGAADDAAAQAATEGLLFLAPQTGRFWHRQAPGEPPLIEVGKVASPGEVVGLIEVMKTFTQVTYRPDSGAGLPERARVVRVLAEDGGEITKGMPLFEVEPA